MGMGYNQAKGINLYGKFQDNKLVTIDLIQNAEMIYYMYDKGELQGIDRGICSRIFLELEEQKIHTATRFVNPSSTTYPLEQFPEDQAKLNGFLCRIDERIVTKDDIFPPNDLAEKEVPDHKKTVQEEANKQSDKKETSFE